MTVKYGEVDWGDSFSGKSSKENGKDVFLRLKNGTNTIRLVTKPFQYLVHKSVKKQGDGGYGQKVNCPMSKDNDVCPLCAAGHPVSVRYFVGVIDRATNSYKLLDIGPSVFYEIKKYNDNIRWGDPMKYDLDLTKNDKADPQHYYSVAPVPHSPLSATDQKIIDEDVDLDDLKAKVTPPTLERTQQRLEKILEGGKLHIPPKQEKKAAKSEKVSTPSVVSQANVVDSDDDMFPSYEA